MPVLLNQEVVKEFSLVLGNNHIIYYMFDYDKPW